MTRRIGICGLAVESNSLAPLTTRSDFESFFLAEGDALASALAENPRYVAFAAALDQRGVQWEAVPLLVATAESGGPVARKDYESLRDELVQATRKAGRLDAIWVIGHGAGTIDPRDDMDGDYLQALRQAAGTACRIVALFDYHANISTAMMRALDASVGYRTNPHTDIDARAAECGHVLAQLLAGKRSHTASVRLALITPQIVQRTDVSPMDRIMDKVTGVLRDPNVATASVYPGFALGDTRDNGMSIVVSSWTSSDHAVDQVQALASAVWERRGDFAVNLETVDGAIARACETPGPWILADIADNPGGGGRGNTPHLMAALLAAGIGGVQIVPVFDPPLAREAHALGEGAVFEARFNRAETAAHSDPFRARARVVRLTDGRFRHASGMAEGIEGTFGPSALLDLEGILVGVTSRRRQTLGTSEFHHFGLDPTAARIVVVKSRGHFRAGFKGVIADDRIIEVDAPGLVSANLDAVEWKGLTRPIHPIDEVPDRWACLTTIERYEGNQ